VTLESEAPAAVGPPIADEPPTEPFTSNRDDREQVVADAEAARNPFASTRYAFTTGLRSGEVAYVRDASGNASLSYRSFASVVGIVAALTAAIVVIAGLAAAAFLAMEHRPGAAIAAIVLSFGFSLLIAMLVPPVSVTLFNGQTPALTIAQDSRTPFPTISYAVVTADGHRLARIRRSFLSRLGRNRWRVLDTAGQPIAYAVEESLGRALQRKLFAKFNRAYDANVRVVCGGRDAGTILRRGADADVLQLAPDSPLDPKVAVALALVVLGAEP
jgi:hypothetical protein